MTSDNCRGIKHVDPYGRISLGRRRALSSYAVEEDYEGVITLTPVLIFEKNKFDRWAIATGRPAIPTNAPIVRAPDPRR